MGAFEVVHDISGVDFLDVLLYSVVVIVVVVVVVVVVEMVVVVVVVVVVVMVVVVMVAVVVVLVVVRCARLKSASNCASQSECRGIMRHLVYYNVH